MRSTCVRALAASVALDVPVADKFSDGRRSGPDKSPVASGETSSRGARQPGDASTTAPEVCTRRLTRGNGPRERGVPKFFPSILYRVFPLRSLHRNVSLPLSFSLAYPGKTRSRQRRRALARCRVTSHTRTLFVDKRRAIIEIGVRASPPRVITV